MDQFRRRSERPSRWGYVVAIVASALAHGAIFYTVLVILPRLFKRMSPPPAYTVKIVDAIPAGDLGTHLPRLDDQPRVRNAPATPAPEPSVAEPVETPPPPPIEEDEKAIALNTLHPTRTPTPIPTPRPTIAATRRPTPIATPRPTPRPHPTIRATPRPTRRPTPRPTPHPLHAERPRPTATPTPHRKEPRRGRPVPTPHIAVARVEPTPSVSERLAEVHRQLMAESRHHEHGTSTSAEGGPVVASRETRGKGYGLGPGNGSAGIQQDAGFLLYYQEVQKRIKNAWSFAGDNPDLTATVTFGINPDGTLNSIHVADSSRDPAFDDSVVRAIRRAAPFPPPPPKYRVEFMGGIEAQFKLGDLNS